MNMSSTVCILYKSIIRKAKTKPFVSNSVYATWQPDVKKLFECHTNARRRDKNDKPTE